ncbi:MAG: hypothetical protein JNK40_11090 [Chromatiales bacterium]|nr:hypothetical protein [Chromatiales bacterium]
MNGLAKTISLIVAIATLATGRLLAADDPTTTVPDTKDLTAVIALQGLPCGQVVSATEQGENDFLATCQDGSRYRVWVNADGRVVVEKQ